VVLVTGPIHADGLRKLGDFDLRVHHYDAAKPGGGIPEEDLAVADALIVRAMPVDIAAIEAAPRLRVVAKHGAGVNNIDVAACQRRGIVVTNTGDANSDSVAQLAVTLILSAQRRIAAVHASVANGSYDLHRQRIFPDLMGRKIGLVGFGAIGQRVARICRMGFEAAVIAYDPAMTPEVMAEAGVEKCTDLDDLFVTCDVVSLHVPLNPATHRMVSAARLALMKPTAVLVNTARGEVVDEAALIEALRKGRIWGAGLDAFETEPLLDSPLFGLSNVILSPHIGGATELSRITAAVRAAECVIEVLAGRTPKYLIGV
jgi:D-3-phosphoglycerate dehydrogenase